jgi:hypothetical protein
MQARRMRMRSVGDNGFPELSVDQLFWAMEFCIST